MEEDGGKESSGVAEFQREKRGDWRDLVFKLRSLRQGILVTLWQTE
jgi:hypothetical protein